MRKSETNLCAPPIINTATGRAVVQLSHQSSTVEIARLAQTHDLPSGGRRDCCKGRAARKNSTSRSSNERASEASTNDQGHSRLLARKVAVETHAVCVRYLASDVPPICLTGKGASGQYYRRVWAFCGSGPSSVTLQAARARLSREQQAQSR